MIAKSKTEEEYLVNLRNLFKRLCKYRLRLNPTKCTFRVKSGKLLDLIVSQKGIEVDPDTVKAILEMPKPRIEKQVWGFLGRLNYIARFISQLTATCEPLFKLLHKNQSVQWDDCEILEISTRNFCKRCILNGYIYKYYSVYVYMYIPGRSRYFGGKDTRVRLINEEKSITG